MFGRLASAACSNEAHANSKLIRKRKTMILMEFPIIMLNKQPSAVSVDTFTESADNFDSQPQSFSQEYQMPKDECLSYPRFPRTSAYHPDWVLGGASGGANPLWLTEWLCEVLDLQPGMRVLDLGCGRAMSSRHP